MPAFSALDAKRVLSRDPGRTLSAAQSFDLGSNMENSAPDDCVLTLPLVRCWPFYNWIEEKCALTQSDNSCNLVYLI